MFCLTRWAISVPKMFLKCSSLIENSTSNSLLFTIIHPFCSIIHGLEIENQNTQNNNINNLIDYTITVDNVQDTTHFMSSPKRQNAFDVKHSHEEEGASVIRLAARFLLSHILNYVGHFPQNLLGAARLNCLISEYDDNLKVINNDFDFEVLNAPNIQFFLVNNSSVLSFMELPIEDHETVSKVLKNKCLTRVIIRDICGKYAWDCTQLYSVFEGKALSLDGSLMSNISNESDTRSSSQSNNPSDDEEDFDIKIQISTDALEGLHYNLQQTYVDFNISRKSSGSITADNDLIALVTNQHFQGKFFILT